jgi:hypothetical protein
MEHRTTGSEYVSAHAVISEWSGMVAIHAFACKAMPEADGKWTRTHSKYAKIPGSWMRNAAEISDAAGS